MTEATKKETQEKAAANTKLAAIQAGTENVNGKPAAKQAGAENKQMGIRLAPVENSDQPLVANYCSINVSPGMAFIDFGFLEPGMLAALPQMARSGGKMPERLNGKLAVRVALGYDALANLHQQLGRVLTGLSQAARAAEVKKAA